MDDVLVFGSSQEEHDTRLAVVLQRIAEAGVTLNPDKCAFNREQVKFLGHIVNKNGIRADPDKITAIVKMKAPTNVPELRRFLGMANHLGKFTPRLSQLSQPLRELLSKKNCWTWGPGQTRAFNQIKSELTEPTILTLYDPAANSKVSADASSYGLGAVLLQEVDRVWKPVAYASRSLTETEKRYAQIEKEALGVGWACDRFSNYVLGRSFEIETDHKPLVPILSTKNLDNLPPRVLRFRLRMGRFDYSISHVPGKLLYTADTLSRAPVDEGETLASLSQEEGETYVHFVVNSLPASAERLEEYQKEQEIDPNCSQVMKYCRGNRPKKKELPLGLRPYWDNRNSLTINNGLLLYNHRIVVPSALKKETLGRIHEGHQGRERCRTMANTCVWWPSMSKDITEKVLSCSECAKEAIPKREPLIVSPLPDYPWQLIGTDLFELEGEQYLIVVDYFSRYPEVAKLTSTTSSAIITRLKSIFAKCYEVTMVHNIRLENFPRLQKSMGLNMSRAVRDTHRVMGRQNVLFRPLRRC